MKMSLKRERGGLQAYRDEGGAFRLRGGHIILDSLEFFAELH